MQICIFIYIETTIAAHTLYVIQFKIDESEMTPNKKQKKNKQNRDQKWENI